MSELETQALGGANIGPERSGELMVSKQKILEDVSRFLTSGAVRQPSAWGGGGDGGTVGEEGGRREDRRPGAMSPGAGDGRGRGSGAAQELAWRADSHRKGGRRS